MVHEAPQFDQKANLPVNRYPAMPSPKKKYPRRKPSPLERDQNEPFTPKAHCTP